jgi:site-specific recombinase XerD
MSYLKNTGSKASTRNQRLTALKTYLWFAADKNISLQSIALEASRVKTSKTRSPSREVLSEKALTAILAQPADTRMGLRDRTIMTLLYDSAARLAEILDLRMENITLDGSDPHIRVRGKGDKERVVSISEPAVKHLRYYSQYYRDCDNPETNLFFYTIINNTVNKMSESNVERFVQDYADKARAKCQEIPASVYPHMFRRTRATHLYQDGVALPLVSRILGHAQLDTTSNIYAKPSIKMMRDALNSGTQNENCAEKPLWIGSEDDLAKKSGLR